MAAKKKKRLINIVNSYKVRPRVGEIDYTQVDGEYTPLGNYVKFPKHSKMQKYLKRQSNSMVRRSDLTYNGNSYRKMMEYKWHFW